MILLRRYLVLIALMFWQGGFTFYAAVVVPVGTAALGNSTLRQGFITRRVTVWLNHTAAASLAVLAVDLLLSRDPSRRRRWARRSLWLFMVACQVLLYRLHGPLDDLMQAKGLIILDREAFRPMHRLYLWTHTFQWAAGLVYVGLMLGAWRREDREEEARKNSAVDRLGVAQSPKQPRRNTQI